MAHGAVHQAPIVPQGEVIAPLGEVGNAVMPLTKPRPTTPVAKQPLGRSSLQGIASCAAAEAVIWHIPIVVRPRYRLGPMGLQVAERSIYRLMVT